MKVLLVYFSGCGYTFWTAQKIASLLSEQGHTISGVLNLEQYAPAEQEASDRHVFLTPTYFFEKKRECEKLWNAFKGEGPV